jgi:EmrB/QacA subfamily drug resistance transporter
VTTPDADRRLRRAALAASALSSFLTPFMGSAMNVGLPSVAREFGLDAVTLGWVATSYILAAAAFLVPFGRLGDILGRKNIFALGLGVYVAGTSVCGLAPSGGVLIAGRIVQGLGAAMVFGTGIAILMCVFPSRERGRALGINTAATYIGLSIGPVLGGFLVQRWGWRAIFWTSVPFALGALGLVVAALKGEWADARGEAFDYAGSAAFGLGLVGLMYGFSRLPAPSGILLTAAGAAALAVFVRIELRSPRPVLDVRLFRRNRIFAFSNVAALINYSATSAVSFLLSLYLQYIKGLPPRQAGLVLVVQPILMALTSPGAGRLSDRAEPRILASVGMGLTSIGLALFAFLDGDTTLAAISAGLALLGLGFGLFSSPNTNAVMGSVEKKLYGVASATLGTMRLGGQMLSLGVTMLLFSLVMGRVPIQPANFPHFLRSVRIAFVFYAALCVAGVWASLARGNRNGITTPS